MAIVQLRLLLEDLPKFSFNKDYWFDTIQLSSIEDYREKIDKVILHHHEDIDWDAIPVFDSVKKRIESGSSCHLWMYKDQALGWHWTNGTCVAKDWMSCHQTLGENEMYIGGAFLSRRYKPSATSSYYFYRQGFEYSFKYHQADTMYLYSDDWNRASAQLCYKCGFEEYEFLVG